MAKAETTPRPTGVKARRRAGFTLLELMTVVVVLGILAALSIARFRDSKERGLVATMKSDLRTVAGGAEAYFAANDSYVGYVPPRMSDGVTLEFTSSATGWEATVRHGAVPGMSCVMRAGPDADADATRAPTCR
jgi:general secretion pathway protein G